MENTIITPKIKRPKQHLVELEKAAYLLLKRISRKTRKPMKYLLTEAIAKLNN